MSEKFVIVVNNCEVSILDTDNDVTDENLEIFSVDFEDNEVVADYIAYELEPLVRVLNEQDKLLKEAGITL